MNNPLFNYWLCLFVFVAHIIANLIITKPNPELFSRVEKLTLFPPAWVFLIWNIIWALQSILFYNTYNSAFWSNSIAAVFLLICIGNIGSQYAGANNYSWIVYIILILCMLINAVFFMEMTSAYNMQFPVARYASQIYVGWASLAFIVGCGIILVTDQAVVSDTLFTIIGSVILILVPAIIWVLWWLYTIDYRIVSLPYFLVLFAFALRAILR
jgi:hypothetical protein